MELQTELNFKEKYRHNPVAFAEDMLNVKLNYYQKAMLNTMSGISKMEQYLSSRTRMKHALANASIEYMRYMERDFHVWRPGGIEVYEKGILVKQIKSRQ